SRVNSPCASRDSSCPTRMADGLAWATTRALLAIRTGADWCCFTNIFTATPAAASARSTRPAGRPSSRDCWRTWAESENRDFCPALVRQGSKLKGQARGPPYVQVHGESRREREPHSLVWRPIGWRGRPAI